MIVAAAANAIAASPRASGGSRRALRGHVRCLASSKEVTDGGVPGSERGEVSASA